MRDWLKQFVADIDFKRGPEQFDRLAAERQKIREKLGLDKEAQPPDYTRLARHKVSEEVKRMLS